MKHLVVFLFARFAAAAQPETALAGARDTFRMEMFSRQR
jgi:hypothetical protein